MPRVVPPSWKQSARAAEAPTLFPADLQDAASARDLARRALATVSQIDILINNAAIFPFGTTAETTEETFDGVYNVNVKVPFVLVGELAPEMARRGNGAIVNVSSMAPSSACKVLHSMVRAKPRSTY